MGWRERAQVAWIWVDCRRRWGWPLTFSDHPPRGLGFLDGALALAAETRSFERFEFLLGLGADPTIVSWLPLRMACADGCDAWVERLLEIAPPSPAGLDLALCWAGLFEKNSTELILAAHPARREAREMAGHVPGGQAIAKARRL